MFQMYETTDGELDFTVHSYHKLVHELSVPVSRLGGVSVTV